MTIYRQDCKIVHFKAGMQSPMSSYGQGANIRAIESCFPHLEKNVSRNHAVHQLVRLILFLCSPSRVTHPNSSVKSLTALKVLAHIRT